MKTIRPTEEELSVIHYFKKNKDNRQVTIAQALQIDVQKVNKILNNFLNNKYGKFK